jgi:3',5'-cyclic AMP phosphodiesterase CpdA
MRTIAHISDLHFGREDPVVVDALRAELQARRPSLVVVSGDLTQRARRRQFEAAAAFLASLEVPVLPVPGNHDIPLFDLARRAFQPVVRYQRWINRELEPFHRDPAGELAVLGLNTARAYLWKNGEISPRQLDLMRARFAAAGPVEVRLLVTHHPFVPRPGDPHGVVVGRGMEALKVAEACGVDVLLAGHLHQGYVVDVRTTHRGLRRGMLVAQAGTAVSHRRRREPNAYNWITVDPPYLRFEARLFAHGAFSALQSVSYARREEEWVKVPPEA